MEPNQGQIIYGNQAPNQGNIMYQQGQPGYIPPQSYGQGQQVYVQQPIYQTIPLVTLFRPRMSGFDKLLTVQGVYIKQKFMALQAITGCEQTHRHFVYALGADGKTKKHDKMFKCKEVSSFCARQCVTPSCRPFNMDVTHKDYLDPTFDKQPFVRFEREFQCTCLCINRPVLKVISNEGGQDTLLGKIIEPFKCCDPEVNIYSATDDHRFKIVGTCCQLGVICQGPCCQDAHFDIKNSSGEVVGELKRVKGSFLQNMVETVANFTVTFPTNADGAERAMLIAAAIMIDFAYFDKKSKGVMNGGSGAAFAN